MVAHGGIVITAKRSTECAVSVQRSVLDCQLGHGGFEGRLNWLWRPLQHDIEQQRSIRRDTIESIDGDRDAL